VEQTSAAPAQVPSSARALKSHAGAPRATGLSSTPACDANGEGSGAPVAEWARGERTEWEQRWARWARWAL